MALIRDASPSDAAAITALWNPWITGSAITFNPKPHEEGEVAAMILARQSGGHGFWLAEREGPEKALLGFASYSQFRSGLGYSHTMEHTVILAEAARGKGIGRRLMARLEDHARASGVHLMIGAVSGENPEGRAFHEALGYHLCGTLPGAGFKFGRKMDLWLMGKSL